MKLKIFFLMIISASSMSAWATMGKESGGGGGDASCAEYSDYVGRVASALVTIGQDKVNSINAVIQVADLWKIKQSLKCFPVTALNRQAWSYPSDLHTDLLTSAWAILSVPQKLRLAIHELAILAQYENDGEYFISDSILQMLNSYSPSIRNLLQANQVINNTDGSVTFIEPFVMIEEKTFYIGYEVNNWSTSTNRETLFVNGAGNVCKYLGYARAINYAHTQWSNTDGQIYATIDDGGILGGFWTKQSTSIDTNTSVAYFETITCK